MVWSVREIGIKAINYLGQLRLYSFLDLVLLLCAAGAEGRVFFGALSLWVAFIVYLEVSHAHEYRAKFPDGVWQVLLVLGLILYGRVEGLLFVVASYFYTQKNKGSVALWAPFFRGFQNFFLVAGLVGYQSYLPWIALVLIGIRNLAGDFRDAAKDAQEEMKTIPILLGWKNNMPHVHLIFLMITTLVWWRLTGLGVQYFILVWLVQLFTYNLTPR